MTPILTATRLGSITLPNRWVVAPMTRTSAQPVGTPPCAMAEYYRTFAVGAFGLIVTEGIYTDRSYSQGYLEQPGLATAHPFDGWAHVTRRVLAAGGRIIAQLMHAGALSQGNPHRENTAGPPPSNRGAR